MAFEFTFPDVGEGVAEGTLVKWKVKVGDTVKEDDPICDVETAKALVEVPSPRAGTILSLNFKEGDTIHVGDVLVVIGEAGEKVAKKETPAPAAKSAAKTEPVAKKEAPKEPAEKAPPVEKTMPVAPPEKAKPKPQAAPVVEHHEIQALPAARKKAKELGIDIGTVTATGKGGVITLADVERISKGAPVSPAASTAEKPTAASAAPVSAAKEGAATVGFGKFGRFMRMPLSGMRKAIAHNMAEAKRTIPHVTHIDEADITALDALRKKKKEYADNKGIHLTLLPFIMKAAVSALKKYPFLNASFDPEKQDVLVKEYYHVGFAVDTPHGLYVPVIKDVDKESILELAKRIEVLAIHCKQRDLPVKDMQGASFTLTNIGSYGGTAATPIIPPGSVAILGLYRMREKPVVRDGTVVIRKVMPLSITFDHRVVDGGYAARFMNELIGLLQDPDLFFVDMI